MGADAASQGRLTAALSCFGLMADLYDFGIVNLVRPMLEDEFGTMTPNQDALFTGSALLGAFVGMIGFGTTADFIGRRWLFITTATLVGVASLGSACAGPALGFSIFPILALWRFLMGLGIGGEYPLAAASTAENSDPASSSRSLAVVFFGMWMGGVLAPSVVLLLAGPFQVPGPRLWRYAFGFGAILALGVAALRFFALKETRAWEVASRSAPQPSTHREEASWLQRLQNKLAALSAMKWSMMGTVGVWLFYDIVTYGTGLYSTRIFPAEPGLGSGKVVLYINLLTLPGFAGAVLLAPRVPMRHLQLCGLLTMCACFATMAFVFGQASRSGFGFLSLFAFQRCIDAMGPGVATFTIPGQIYPTRIRATAHGISAASGKAGAVIGTVIFPHLYAAAGLKAVMAFMASVCAFSALATQLYTPLYDETVLEDIASLDSNTELVQQATMAESLLFAASKSHKAECTSLRSLSGGDHSMSYGAQQCRGA